METVETIAVETGPSVVTGAILSQELQDFMTDVSSGEPFTRTFEPAFAAELMAAAGTRNRTLSDKTVDKYADAMAQGEWKFNGDAIRFYEDGKLADGQHRLHACIKAQVAFTSIVVGNVPHEAMPTIDTDGKRRTAADALGLSDIDKGGIKAKIAKELLRFQKYGKIGGTVPSVMETIAFCKMHDMTMDNIIKIAEAIVDENGKKILNQEKICIWLMLNKLHNSKEYQNAVALIEEVASGNANTANPTHVGPVLYDYFYHTKYVECKNLNLAAVLGTITKAWNAEKKGKTISRISQGMTYPAKRGEKFPKFNS